MITQVLTPRLPRLITMVIIFLCSLVTSSNSAQLHSAENKIVLQGCKKLKVSSKNVVLLGVWKHSVWTFRFLKLTVSPTPLCALWQESGVCTTWGCVSLDSLLIFQRKTSYEIVGLSNAPDFFSIDAKSGEIKLKTDLRTDPVKQKFYVVCPHTHTPCSTDYCTYTVQSWLITVPTDASRLWCHSHNYVYDLHQTLPC